MVLVVDEMRRARIAVVGVGKFGQMHLRAFSQMQADGKAELAAAADVNPAAREACAQAYGVPVFADHREMLARARPDGVAIVTPDFLHREIALDCLAAGAHVLVEKPLDLTVDGCQEIARAAADAGLLVQVDFHKRFDPYHRELHRLAGAGALGEIEYGYAYMEDRIEVPRDWFPHWAPCTSPAWFLGVHMYDLARWVMRSDGRLVSATGSKKKLASLGIDAYDSVQAKVVFENGASFSFDSSWILPDGHEAVVNQGLRVVGTEGMMEIDTQDRGARGCFANGMQTPNAGFYTEGRDARGRARYGGYGIESIQSFGENLNQILEGGSAGDMGGACAGVRDGIEATRIAVAVHRSVAAGGALVAVNGE